MEVRKFPLDHKIFCTGFIFRTREGKRKILREKIPPELSIADFARLKDGLDILDENGEVLFRNQDLTRRGTPSVSYAYCSDTRYNPAIAEQIKEVDLLYHEATFANDMKDRARDTYHSTAEEAALIAKMGQVKKLLLGHFSVRYRELDPVLEEAKKHFNESYLAIEGEVFEV
jgi:ribonuclease Z